jgi:carbonic anhydrase
MNSLQHLIENNRRWSEETKRKEPAFFETLSKQQSPEYLWIGCSDSRVPANEIVNLLPGELFVHRNVANIVIHTDLNCLSVIQYAVDVLKVKHIIVCGHYGCGGVRAALQKNRFGLIDNWLRHIQDIHHAHADMVAAAGSLESQVDRLCELNVITQVLNVCETTIIQDAWERGASLHVHGWIYGLKDGLIRDLNVTMNGAAMIEPVHHNAIKTLSQG